MQFRGNGKSMQFLSGSSLASGQVVIDEASSEFPLFPPRMEGFRRESDPQTPLPLEVGFDYASVDLDLFQQSGRMGSRGLDAWSQLMPPLAAETNLGEGNTPLIRVDSLRKWLGFGPDVYIKDEGRNPTWSHKDRLNRCLVSAAKISGAPGIVVASSGNHGASAGAYAAAAGLPCIILGSASAPLAMRRLISAYGASALLVPSDRRWSLLWQLYQETGFHAVSNLTPEAHTGHAFASEGYKSISFEIFRDLGAVPAAVFVPTGYGELIYGIWKGFFELQLLGLTASVPRLYSCEPSALGPHYRAIQAGGVLRAIQGPNESTRALSIGTTVGGVRCLKALRESDGDALAVSDAEMLAAQRQLATNGLWVELAAAAGVAGLKQLCGSALAPDGPVVCISTSPGLKDIGLDIHDEEIPEIDGSLKEAKKHLRDRYGLSLPD